VYINSTKSRKIGAENFKECCRYHTLFIKFFRGFRIRGSSGQKDANIADFELFENETVAE
jgi:hypothetical protein